MMLPGDSAPHSLAVDSGLLHHDSIGASIDPSSEWRELPPGWLGSGYGLGVSAVIAGAAGECGAVAPGERSWRG